MFIELRCVNISFRLQPLKSKQFKMQQLSRHIIDISSSFQKIQDGRVVALVVVVGVVVGAIAVVVARACRLWNHYIVVSACVPCCCSCQFLA